MNILVGRFWAPALILIFVFTNSSWASLSGRFLVGANGDFSSLRQALDSVAVHGLDGDLELTILAGQETGPFVVRSYAGSGSFRLIFTPYEGGEVTLVSPDTTVPTLQILDGQNITVHGLKVTSASNIQPTVKITGNSTRVAFTDCAIFARSTNRALEVLGPGARDLEFDNCLIRRATDGIVLDGQSASASGISITNCTIDSVQQGISLSRQTQCRVTGCNIKPNLGTAGGATAISIGIQDPADSVFVSANTISEIRTGSGYAVGIRHNPQNSGAFLLFSNNFVTGFQNTGTSQVRAVFVSGGQNRIVNNSILVNDVTATGTAYSLYNGLVSSDARLTLLNNILVNTEATRPAYNAFMLTQAAAVEIDNNIYYGTGSGYYVGWMLQSYSNLNAWQNATGFDAASLEGDPQFTSSTDLHLRPTSALAHQNGAIAPDVSRDIDNSLRFQPPDIGADEYTFQAPPFDAAILNVIGLPTAFPAFSLLRLEVVVQNRGSSPLIELPIRLTYADVARAEVIVDLEPSEADTILLLWSTDGAHATAELIVEAVLGTDVNPQNNARAFNLTVTDQPLQGTYRISGANADFNTLNEATTALASRGINGPVTLELSPGFYADNLILESIFGMNQNSPLTIRPAPFEEGVVQISSLGGQQAVRLSNVSYVTIEGLIIQGNGSTLEAVALANGSHHNTIRSCRILCASQQQSSAAAVAVGAGCLFNTFSQLEISTAYTGIRLDGTSSGSDTGNRISDCSIWDVRTAVLASWQRDLVIENCQITAGISGVNSPSFGIRITSLSSLDTVSVLNNRITNGIAAGSLAAVSCESGNGVVFAANNWIGNFNPQSSGAITALAVGSGTSLFYHNTVRIGEVASRVITGISVAGWQANARLLNNIIEISDTDASARFIEWNTGTIFANYNLYDAPGSNTAFRFASSSLDGEYSSLAAWTEATSQDSQSVTASAGFESPADFHIRPDASGPSNRGTSLLEVTTDLDGTARDSVPDIGADEFVFQTPIADLAVESISLSDIPAASGVMSQVFSVISNVGQTPLPNASATLYYNEIAVETRAVSVDPDQQVELIWNWLAPITDLSFGVLRLEVSASGDVVSANNSRSQSIVVAGSPLADSVVVGMSRSVFSTLEVLSDHLKWRGISGPLTIYLAPEIHTGPLILSNIPGADSLNHVRILPLDASGTAVTAVNCEAVVELRSANFVDIEGVEVIAGQGTNTAILIDDMSCGNSISNCLVTGVGSSNLNTYGIRVSGALCERNEILNNTISACYIGIALTSEDAVISHGNIVSGNEISDIYYGIWVDHQHEAIVSGNDIRPGSTTGPAGGCYGVYILQLGDNGSVRVEGNLIHDFLDSNGPRTNRACGIYSAPGITSYVEIVNNFIYGYSQLTTLRSRGIYLSSGNHLVAHNSIRISDSPADNDHAGVFVSTGSQHELYNNCVMTYENDALGYGLDIEPGASVISDYNCLWGNSANFNYAALGSQNFASLPVWQATGQDLHSYSVHARYVSTTDLHIQPTDSILYARGLALSEVSFDIDGDARAATPCIGADEYTLSTQLSPPTGLTVAVMSSSTVQLYWTPVNGASRYLIYGASTPDELISSPVQLGTTTASSWTWEYAQDSNAMRVFNVRAE